MKLNPVLIERNEIGPRQWQWESFEEDDEKFYDLTELLIAIYLLSKSSQSEKAAALFDLYNDEAKEELTRFGVGDELKQVEITCIYM